MASVVAGKIGEVFKLGLVGALRAEGFKGSGTTFRRERGPAIQIVRAQSSSSNAGAAGRFTVNLGIHFPAIRDALGYPPVEKPTDAGCDLRTRLGSLMSQASDRWWTVDDRSDLRSLGNEVAAAWTQQGLPWLEANSSLEALRDFLARQEFRRPELVAALVALGDTSAAREELQELLKASPGNTFLLAIGSRHGLL